VTPVVVGGARSETETRLAAVVKHENIAANVGQLTTHTACRLCSIAHMPTYLLTYLLTYLHVVITTLYRIIVKKLNSLKHLVRTTVAESHN